MGCADYKIPQVMRGLGILEYDKDLSALLDKKIEIEENSEYSIIKINSDKRYKMVLSKEGRKSFINEKEYSKTQKIAFFTLF